MAYRRRHSTARSATFEDYRSFSCADDEGDSSHSLAAKAIRASAAHRDSSLSSAYDGADVLPSATTADRRSFQKQGSNVYEYSTTRKNIIGRQRFWEVLAKKAKAILEDDEQPEDTSQMPNSKDEQVQTKWPNERNWKTDQNPAFQKDAIVSSLKESSGTLKQASEEGIPAMEGTKKLQIKKPESSDSANEAVDDFTQFQIEYENKLKASQKVANAIAAKAKLLLRELKTVKADFAFAKERCAQLEEENKALRENRQKAGNPADDELIRHQLESLLEEKARLARENSVYASENRFLHEIIEYHQLTMQDVVYLDEGIEEMAEVVYPIGQISVPSSSSHSPVVSSVTTAMPQSPSVGRMEKEVSCPNSSSSPKI